jgi:pSer/pThr/pTyr-binding forkhead associated (FHA) protein
MMKAKLDLIENRLQTLIEGGLTLLIPGGNPQEILTRRLIEAMQSGLVITADGLTTLAPDTYHVSIHPSRLNYWQAHQTFLNAITNELSQTGSQVGFRFLVDPHITILTDASLSTGEIKISAAITEMTIHETSRYSIGSQPSPEDIVETIPQNAFLIVNGQRHFPLNQKVVNIGRRLDNHLVIDDPRVSRNHVQLRAINGHYVIFDLNATGGTYINGQRINQSLLNPGDVISLAGYPLIYGQDVNFSVKDTQTIDLTTREKPDTSP